jgi:hypothetical protein
MDFLFAREMKEGVDPLGSRGAGTSYPDIALKRSKNLIR